MSNDERHYYIAGFQEGTLRLAGFAAYLDGSLTGETSKAVATLGLTAAQRRGLSALIRRDFQRIAVERFGVEVVLRVMTELYSDAANALIPYSNVLTIAILRLGGATDARVSQEMSIMRKVFSVPIESRR